MIKKNFRILSSLSFIVAIMLLYASCEKQEDVIQRDSEQLMTDLQGKWDLVSMRVITLKTTDQGYRWDVDSDDTIAATGDLNIASIDKRDYTGSINIVYDTVNETHDIFGHSYKNTIDERLYINTADQSDIEAFLMYSGESSENMFYIDDREGIQFRIWMKEINGSNTRLMEKHFKFERAK